MHMFQLGRVVKKSLFVAPVIIKLDKIYMREPSQVDSEVRSQNSETGYTIVKIVVLLSFYNLYTQVKNITMLSR